MQIKEFDISTAEGIVLLNDIRSDEKVLPQGHKLSSADVLFLKTLGIKKITGIQEAPGDIPAATALGMIAPQICGNNMVYSILPNSNSCKLVANTDGILIYNENRLSKFNRINPYLVLNAVSAYKNVKKGDVIGSLKLRCPIIEQEFIEDIIFKLSGNEELLTIEQRNATPVTVVYTKFYKNQSENNHFASIVKQLLESFPEFQISVKYEIECNHECDDIAAAISEAAQKSALVFVVPGQPTSYVTDTIPSALKISADEIICDNIPQDILPDLMIATKKDSKIVVLPYHYDQASSHLVDQFIRTAISKEKISSNDFYSHNNVISEDIKLSEEEKQNIVTPPSHNKRSQNEANIAAVILAAGTSTRARCNKLMVDLGGEPLFMKSVRAAMKSKASPVYVVTGYRAEELEEHLEKLDLNILRNNDYASGIKTSIRLAVNSVPSFCDGAILIPADMPFITPTYLNKMIKSFERGNRRQLCVTSFKGQKYNPVLWGRDLYSQADLVPENSHLRAVLMEHVDYTKLIEADAETCVDVNFPYDIEVLTNK